MRFAWDSRKAAPNLRKHGVAFEDAALAFDDPFTLRVPDAKHSNPAGTRMWQIGEARDRRVLVVVFAVRGAGEEKVCRIISARKAGRKERALYEFNKRIPVS